MIDFEYYNPTKIIFGEDAYKNLGITTADYTKKVLLHYGGKSLKANGVYDIIKNELVKQGIEVTELGGVKSNPRLSLVYEGIKLCRKENISFILAAGGGSVIDSAKAIAAGTCYEGDVWDFYEKGIMPKEALDIGVVLTIPAAGSESSNGTVITREESQEKKSFCCDLLYPRFAFLNPTVCKTLPQEQIAAGGADILSHIMERYFTCTGNTDFSDRLCEAAMRSLIHNLPLAAGNRENKAAWAEVMWIGNVAHNTLLGKGREEDWACHAMEHELSAIYDIAHGAGLAVIYPAWMKYTYKHNMARFVQFAVRVFDVDISYQKEEEIVWEGIRRTEDFFRKIGLPVDLCEYGMDESDFERMAARACNGGSLGAFMKLEQEDVIQIYQLAYGRQRIDKA